MAVGVVGQDRPRDERLDLLERPPGGDIVGIDELPRPEGTGDFDPLADDARPKRRDTVRACERGSEGEESVVEAA